MEFRNLNGIDSSLLSQDIYRHITKKKNCKF